MQKKTIIFVLLILILPGPALAYLERADNIVSDDGNVIYMIGWIYNRITDAKMTSKEDLYRIYKITLKDMDKTLIYDGDNKPMDRLTMSPDNNYIAVMRREKDKYNHTEILIIDKKRMMAAQWINEPNGLITYAWSPDSKKIAYLSGVLGERGKIHSKGIFIYNFEKKEKVKITESALDLEWLPTGDLLLYSAYIEQLDGNKKRVYKATSYSDSGLIQAVKNGINLSLDGRYSIDPRYIGRSEDIMDDIPIDFIDLNENTTFLGSTLNNIFAKRTRILWEPVLWLKGNRLVIEREIQNSLDWEISICDFVANRELKIIRGRIVGVNKDRSKLIIYTDSKFSSVDVP